MCDRGSVAVDAFPAARLRGGLIVRVVLAVIAGFLILQVTPLLLGAAVLSVVPDLSATQFFGATLIAGFACSVLAGWVTALIGAERGRLAVYILIGLAAASYLAWFFMASAPNPIWYRLGSGPALIGGALIGGLLISKQARAN